MQKLTRLPANEAAIRPAGSDDHAMATPRQSIASKELCDIHATTASATKAVTHESF
ncbi:MAG TPA: hypothetical protein VFE77_01025 [Rhodanobacter sp.]|nr:hypothetical protein [Rhodanobacter sp.]